MKKILVVMGVMVFLVTGLTTRQGMAEGRKKEPTPFVRFTFDDGPGPYTKEILDILEKEKIKAVFFVVGLQVKKYPHILKEIAKRGHIIGNHTYRHARLSKLEREQIREEILEGEKIIISNLGGETEAKGRFLLGDGAIIYGQKREFKLFRAPYLENDKKIIEEAEKMDYLSWNEGISGDDWKKIKPEEIVRRVLMRMKDKKDPAYVIILHDIQKGAPEILKMLIKIFKERGYDLHPS